MTYLTIRRPVGNPFSFHNEIGRLFSDVFGADSPKTELNDATWRPTVDVSETENGFEIRAELPGVSENDLNVSVTDNLLTIKGEKHQEAETDGKNYHRVERRYGSFQRQFTLPREVETDSIKAEYTDGVLTLSIPKAEAAKPTEISITTTS